MTETTPVETPPRQLGPAAVVFDVFTLWLKRALEAAVVLLVLSFFVVVLTSVFYRYVLNDSYAWTEEIAVNCLIGVVFLGSVMCVRMSRHIQVDVLYHYVPPQVARAMSILVDVLRILFFAYTSWLMWRYLEIVADEEMVTVALPRNIVFYTVLAAFVLMLFRSVQVFIANMQRGYSVLERPEEFQSAGD